ncbi:hypothetical protein ABTK06_19790, partial [Acinetobacter baumannii]
TILLIHFSPRCGGWLYGDTPHGLAFGLALSRSPSASVVLACGFVGFGFALVLSTPVRPE